MVDQETVQQSLPTHTTQGIRYRPRMRGWIIGIGLAGSLLVFLLGYHLVALLVAAIAGLLSIPAINGRTFVYTEVISAWISVRLRGQRGRLGYASVSSIIYSDEEYLERIKTPSVEVNFLPMDNFGQSYLTEVYTPDNGRHTLYVLFDSWGGAHVDNARALRDQTENFGQACRNLAASYGPDLRVSMFRFTVPHDPTNDLAYLEANKYRPPDPDEDDAKAIAQRARLLELQGDFAEAIWLQERVAVDYICGIALNVVRPKEWSKLKPQNLRTSNIIASDGYRLTEQLITYLGTHGAANVRRPDPYETAILLRGTLDSTALPEMYRSWREDRKRFGTHEFRTLEDSLVLASGPLPLPHEIVAKRDYLRVAERSYTQTFHCPEFTRRQVDAGAMQRLFMLSDQWRAGITLTYRVADAKTEQRVMKSRVNEAETKKYRRRLGGRADRAKDEVLDAQLREDDYALYLSSGDTLHLHLLATVNAESPEQLAWRRQELIRHFTGTTVPMEVIKGEAVQYPARLETLGVPSA